jgi:hypothetical protein
LQFLCFGKGVDKIINRHKAKTLLKFDVTFEYYMGQDDKTYAIKLKIGENNTYEIDNIKAFILALKYKSPLNIGDSFAYVPRNHCFK